MIKNGIYFIVIPLLVAEIQDFGLCKLDISCSETKQDQENIATVS